ncbi:methyltransferase domain-containing protein [Colletotrichum plurivorum]|uniref:Methyltransferase domain-containing protein n=1 Tax=Colletotrichum plurivorum TaxID=2175906 RepID=A0A8H6KYI6_9PEZI|nr:methyltransferase domain-containing protein [Colletotrichum plurivorum]
MSSIPGRVAAAPIDSTSPTDAPGEEHITAGPAAEETDNESQAETKSILSSSTASLTKSITEYRRLHGRTYTQKIDYWGPNDERQNEGLDINHYWMTLFLNDKLCLSPIGDSPQNVLDVGTGTGIWAIDFADEFPSAEVIGIDISPIQPSWVPPNCKFNIDDIEQPWTFPDNFFDLVHIRDLQGSVSDWTALYKQAFAAIKPGGDWRKFLSQACEKLGKVANQGHPDEHGIAKALQEAGFVDIVEKKWPIPIGGWARDSLLQEVGISSLQFLDQSIEGSATFLLKEVLGWEYAEVVVFISEARKALRDAKTQPFFYLVYAQRPEVEISPAPAE